MMRLAHSILLLLLALCSPVRAAGSVHWQSPDYLMNSFVDIALNNEYAPQKSPVRKWTSPIDYFLLHRVGDSELHARLIRTHLEQLSAITGLTIRPAESQKAANFLIVLSTEPQLRDDLLNYFGWKSSAQREKFFRESMCLGIFATSPTHAINRAVVIIPVDRAREKGKLVSCVVEELTQVLGLPNDSEKVFPSIFNDLSTDVYLSGLDYLLLKMLYDPRVKAGMDEHTVRPVLKKVIDEYSRDNKLIGAEKEVMSRGLWRLSQ
jgi:hypothetical protein